MANEASTVDLLGILGRIDDAIRLVGELRELVHAIRGGDSTASLAELERRVLANEESITRILNLLEPAGESEAV